MPNKRKTSAGLWIKINYQQRVRKWINGQGSILVTTAQSCSPSAVADNLVSPPNKGTSCHPQAPGPEVIKRLTYKGGVSQTSASVIKENWNCLSLTKKKKKKGGGGGREKGKRPKAGNCICLSPWILKRKWSYQPKVFQRVRKTAWLGCPLPG